MVEWGDKIQFLEDIEEGGITPKALQNQPVLHDWMREYVDAFQILNGTRQVGMGICPISLSEILAYLKIYGTDDVEAFVHYLRLMDDSFLSVKAKLMEQESNGAKSSP